MMLFTKSDADRQLHEAEDSIAGMEVKSHRRVALTAFGVVFVSEWGDLTQLATMNLSARYDDPLGVALGSLSALWLVSALGVLLGRKLVKHVPLELVRRIAGIVLLGLGLWAFFDFAKAVA